MLDALRKYCYFLLLLFSLFYFFCVPVAKLIIRSSDGKTILESPLAPGDSFVLGFIHSVEQTPVESEFRVLAGKVRQWEERFVSHNAGLPTEAPPNGKFIMDSDWMILRGGGLAVKSFRYRVGNGHFGRNFMTLPNGSDVNLFKEYPGRLLFFSSESTFFLKYFVDRVF